MMKGWPHNFVIVAGVIFLTGIAAYSQTSLPDVDAKLTHPQEFVLSPEAVLSGVDGKLLVYLSIDKTGTVKEAEVVAGPAWPCRTNPKKEIKDVIKAVEQNLKNSRFSPAIRDDKPVSSEVHLVFTIGKAYRAAIKERDAEEAALNGIPLPKIVDSGVLNGRALNLVRPSFPPGGSMMNVGGKVRVDVIIEEDGTVGSAGVFSGPDIFQKVARDAACASRFSPTILRGKPIRALGFITYNFIRPPITFRR